jgi:hypothetical protein
LNNSARLKITVTANISANGIIAIFRLRETPFSHGDSAVEMTSFLMRRIERVIIAMRLRLANMLTVVIVEMVAVVTVEDIYNSLDLP